MRVIAANGVLCLVPCAVALWYLAQQGELGPTFYAVQAVELAAGAVNVTLIGLNIQAGRRLAARAGRSNGVAESSV